MYTIYSTMFDNYFLLDNTLIVQKNENTEIEYFKK